MPPKPKNPELSVKTLQRRLLRWFDHNRRAMPWRAPKGVQPDPYHIWLSEIMLQQTTVAAVGPYFEKFIRKWPSVHDLAKAELDAVLQAWAGLGYYARARNLHKCARTVSKDLHGHFPQTEEGLLTLPGIGPYTAAAVAAIAFNVPAVAVDGNVERVVSRFHALKRPLPDIKAELRQHASLLGCGTSRAGDFVQAFMELGATICTPVKPDCPACPWQESCRAKALGIAEKLPVRPVKKKKPLKYGHVFWIEDGKGRVLVRRRPEKGLLGGMMEFPGTDWLAELPPAPSFTRRYKKAETAVKHSFTHFDLELHVFCGKKAGGNMPDVFWHEIRHLQDLALSSLMKKVARIGQSGARAQNQV